MAAQQLPSKEKSLFNALVRHYETKQYKKAIKAADQILKKAPDHGETLAMKGLTLSCIDGRKEEAYDLVRLGLKKDMRSHVCWHVYGLMYRADRDYPQAIKCYRNALRLDKENMQILRDLSLLQVQMRDVQGFQETRHQLLTLKPTHRQHWMAYAIAQHLNGSCDLAVQVLNTYEGTIEGEIPASEKYEHSEMLLYRSSILEEEGKAQAALAELEKEQEAIVDKLAMMEQRARLLRVAGHLAASEAAYRELLGVNPDNYTYHEGLRQVLEQQGGAVDLKAKYEELSAQYPKSSAAQRIPLDFLEGADFVAAAERYVLRFLRKGIPSLFSDLSALCRSSSAKAAALEAMFSKAAAGLKKDGTLGFSTLAMGETEDPACLVWVLFFQAQFYDQAQRWVEALAAIDAAVEHTPSIADLYLCKARILRNAGDTAAAWKLADEARKMDLADRYLNSECTKIMLQADEVDTAHDTIALFARDGEQKQSNLHEMQSVWFETEAGMSHLRREQYGQALAQLTRVGGHFADMTEDQFDFHTYCLRKMTLRAYVDLLRMEERLHGHPSYCQAAYGVVRAYVGVADQEVMSDAERKVVQEEEKKARKAKLKVAKERRAAEEAKREEEDRERRAAGKPSIKRNKEEEDRKAKEEDEAASADPAAALAAVADPLAEAAKPLQLLQLHACRRLQTHQLAFEVYLRQGSVLLALRAVRRMRLLAPAHCATHSATVRLLHYVVGQNAAAAAGDRVAAARLPAVVLGVVDAAAAAMGVPKACSVADLVTFNRAFEAANASSLPHVMTAARMEVLLTPGSATAAAARVVGLKGKLAGVDARDLFNGHRLLAGPLAAAAAAKEWAVACAALNPLDPRWKALAA